MLCHDIDHQNTLVQERLASSEKRADLQSSREELILQHLSQVNLLARRIKARLPAWVNEADLIAAGIIGLIAAVDFYQPEYQASLRTFAEHKIRSAMLDSLRALDWVPRTQRKRGRLLEKTRAALEQKHQRFPTEQEMAAELGITLAEYYTWQAVLPKLTLASWEDVVVEHATTTSFSFSSVEQQGPWHVYERVEQENNLQKAIQDLPERERDILRLHYYENHTLADIARIFKLHESRVSQIKKQAVQKLRRALHATHKVPTTMPSQNKTNCG